MLIKSFIKAIIYGVLYGGAFWIKYLPLCTLTAYGCEISGNRIALILITLGLILVSTILFSITLVTLQNYTSSSWKYAKLEPLSLLFVGITFPFTFFLITGQVNAFFYVQGFWLNSVTASITVALIAFIWNKKQE